MRAGERQIGWKVGFGAPAALEKLETDRPLVGFLTGERAWSPTARTVPIGGWTKPMLEAEIAVHLARDVPGGARGRRSATRSAACRRRSSSPTSTRRPRTSAAILAGNIFHRHVVLGPVDRDRSTGEGIGARVVVDGEEVAATDDPAALTGEIVEVVRLTAETLAAGGERLRAGEVVITGSALPPQPVAPGQHVEVELGPLGALSLRLTPG